MSWFETAAAIVMPLERRSRFDGGRYVGPWELHLERVFGGYRLVWRRWHRTEEGWDEDVLELQDAEVGLDSHPE